MFTIKCSLNATVLTLHVISLPVTGLKVLPGYYLYYTVGVFNSGRMMYAKCSYNNSSLHNFVLPPLAIVISL